MSCSSLELILILRSLEVDLFKSLAEVEHYADHSVHEIEVEGSGVRETIFAVGIENSKWGSEY